MRGSTVLQEARSREAALRQEWQQIAGALEEASAAAAAAADNGAAAPCLLPPAAATAFSEPAFLAAMTVVLAHAAYLPSAQCFALLPLVGGLRRTGSAAGAALDYDEERQAVVLVAQLPYRCGVLKGCLRMVAIGGCGAVGCRRCLTAA